MAQVRHQWGHRPPIAGQVEVDTAFYLPWPVGAPQHQPQAIARWRNEHLTMKPDLDNLRKACIDAVARILFEVGDQQVVEGRMSKDFTINLGEGYTRIIVRVPNV